MFLPDAASRFRKPLFQGASLISHFRSWRSKAHSSEQAARRMIPAAAKFLTSSHSTATPEAWKISRRARGRGLVRSTTPLPRQVPDSLFGSPSRSGPEFPPHRSLCSHSSAMVASSKSAPGHGWETGDVYCAVDMPLCEREAQEICRLGDVLVWKTEAREKASRLGETFASEDNGPTSQELFREIDWLLDDCVAYYRHGPPVGVSSLGDEPLPWLPCTWKGLELRFPDQFSLGAEASLEVLLRCGLEDLYQLWRRRLEIREPFQYLISTAHWRDFILAVQPGVLIPRPETEQMIDLVEKIALGKDPSLQLGCWVDLGTGSGALALGLARLLPRDARVVAVDLSPVAVAVAKRNVERYGYQFFRIR